MKKYIKYAGIVIIISLTILIAMFYKVRHTESDKMQGLNFSTVISETATVSQKFIPKYSILNKVGILIWYNSEAVDKGVVDLAIEDVNGKTLYEGHTTIEAQDIGAYYYFDTKLEVNRNESYTIKINAKNCTTSEPQIGLTPNGDVAHVYNYLSSPPYFMYVTYGAIMCILVFLYFWLVNHINWILGQIKTGSFLKEIFCKKTYFFICAMGCISGCLYYNNALNDTGHSIGLYILEISMGLFSLGLFKKQDIKLLYLGIGFTTIFITRTLWFYKDWKMGISSQLIYELGYVSFLIWGLVLLLVLRKIMAGQIKLKQFRVIPVILWMVLIGSMIFFGVKTEWRIFITLCCSLYYMIPVSRKERDLIQCVFENALLTLLAGMTLFSMAFRPIDLQRYPGVFHTTNWGSEFYLIALIILISRLYKQIRQKDPIRKMVINLVLWAIAWSYLLYTASRGSMIAAFLCCVVAAFFIVIKDTDKKIIYFIKCVATMITVIILAYPVLYCMQRSIPYMVNKPYHYGFEEMNGEVTANQDIDEEHYFELSENLESLYIRVVPGQIQVLFEKDSDQTDNTDIAELETSITDVQVESIYGTYGRQVIINAFLNHVGIWGQSEGVMVGTEIFTSAHNTFVQTAYTFGIITCAVFILFLMVQFCYKGIWLFKTKNNDLKLDEKNLFGLLVILSFVCFGLLECGIWPMHILTFYMYFSSKNFLQKECDE